MVNTHPDGDIAQDKPVSVYQTIIVKPLASAERIPLPMNVGISPSLPNARQNKPLSRTPRENASIALRADLLKACAPEQRASVAEDKNETPILIKSLPAAIQKRVLVYVQNQAMAIGWGGRAQNASDQQWKDFSIVFLPSKNAPRGALGINGFGANGAQVDF